MCNHHSFSLRLKLACILDPLSVQGRQSGHVPGSPLQGWDMKARAGKKPVVLELGGNAAAVLEDYRGRAELDAIVPKLIHGAFYQSGQSCISLQRLFVRHVSLFTSTRCLGLPVVFSKKGLRLHLQEGVLTAVWHRAVLLAAKHSHHRAPQVRP